MGKRPRGALPDWQPTTARQAGILADVLAMYDRHNADDTLPRGGRGIFYDLRPDGPGHGVTYRKPDSAHPVKTFGPMEVHPAAVQDLLVLARRAGMVPEQWVADGRAPDSLGDFYDASAEDEADRVAASVREAPDLFHLDPQRFQPVYIEILCEAADLQPRIARIANPYGVRVYSGSGYDGLKGKRAMAVRAWQRDRPTLVLHLGDRDDHGERIYVAVAEDVIGWVGGGGMVQSSEWYEEPADLATLCESMLSVRGIAAHSWVEFVRLGLTTAQADALDLLDADGKAEADAIPVPVLDALVRDAIEAVQDPAMRERHKAEQTTERERLPGLIADRVAEPDG